MRHDAIKVELEQGSDSWHEWRSKKITASRVPCIMGESPFKTPYQTWEDLIGLSEKITQTEAMKRGVVLEPHVRQMISQRLQVDLQPWCYQHPTIPYFGASLDGICPDEKVAVEIKCGNAKDHELAKNGEVPLKYKGQIQAIMEVVGLDIMYYCSYYERFGLRPGEEGELVIIPVARDLGYVTEMLAKIHEFWKMVQDFTPPDRDNKDFVFNDSDAWVSKAGEYKSLENAIKDLERRKEGLRKDLLSMTNGMSTMGAGLRIAKILEKGRVDYNRIPELMGVNLDAYRKEPITKWRFT